MATTALNLKDHTKNWLALCAKNTQEALDPNQPVQIRKTSFNLLSSSCYDDAVPLSIRLSVMRFVTTRICPEASNDLQTCNQVEEIARIAMDGLSKMPAQASSATTDKKIVEAEQTTYQSIYLNFFQQDELTAARERINQLENPSFLQWCQGQWPAAVIATIAVSAMTIYAKTQ